MNAIIMKVATMMNTSIKPFVAMSFLSAVHLTTFSILMQATHLGNLVADKKYVVSVKASDTIQHVLAVLRDNDILSCPVLDTVEAVIGVASVLDIASYLSWRFDLKLTQPIETVLGLSPESRTTWLFEPHENLTTLFEPFALGYHRVLVRQKGGMCNLSQSDVLKFVYEHNQIPDSLLNSTLEELNLASKEVQTIGADKPALEGLKKISSSCVSAVAVIDSNGELVGNLSASDLRGLTEDSKDLVSLRVLDFLSAIKNRGKPAVGKDPRDSTPLVCSSPLDHLRVVVEKMIKIHVYRVWVVKNNQPVSVVSLTDIFIALKKFLGM